jgi:hypothetical protein
MNSSDQSGKWYARSLVGREKSGEKWVGTSRAHFHNECKILNQMEKAYWTWEVFDAPNSFPSVLRMYHQPIPPRRPYYTTLEFTRDSLSSVFYFICILNPAYEEKVYICGVVGWWWLSCFLSLFSYQWHNETHEKKNLEGALVGSKVSSVCANLLHQKTGCRKRKCWKEMGLRVLGREKYHKDN